MENQNSTIISRVILGAFFFIFILFMVLLSSPAYQKEKVQIRSLQERVLLLEQELELTKQRTYNDSLLLSDYQEVMLQVIKSSDKTSRLFLYKMDSLNTEK